MFVVTADQRSSRTSDDRVPAGLDLIERVAGGRLALQAERNAGDEVQALTDDADAALAAALALVRTGEWSVGLGVGPIELPLPQAVRAARGEAFLHARDAVERAKTALHRVAVSSADAVAAEDAEALLRLLLDLRDRRSAQGWEVADLLAQGLTQKQIAARLGIGESAVSLRARAAGLRVDEAAVPALARVLTRLDS